MGCVLLSISSLRIFKTTHLCFNPYYIRTYSDDRIKKNKTSSLTLIPASQLFEAGINLK